MDSVLNQSFHNYELIVINDGSSDSTKQIVNSYISKSDNLNFITYDNNRGVNYARNRGIEQARGKFILFLDSDDCLSANALQIIYDNIIVQDDFDHYLFGVSDRISDPELPKEAKVYKFSDWLSGKIKGDFAHVIKPSCFEALNFVEDFRLYESLNWLRVLKRNERQLFLPDVVLVRDRNRNDSLTNEAILNNRQSILNNYKYLSLYISWYGDDFIKEHQPDILLSHFKKAFLLGLASGLITDNQHLLMEMEKRGFKIWKYKLLNKRVFSPLIYKLLIAKSNYNQKQKGNK